MSELLTQWSQILAYLGDEMSQDGFQNTNYSNTPTLTPEQLKAINDKLLTFVESLDKHQDQKDELLEMMREFDPTDTMRGGKPTRKTKSKKSKKSKKTRKNRRV